MTGFATEVGAVSDFVGPEGFTYYAQAFGGQGVREDEVTGSGETFGG